MKIFSPAEGYLSVNAAKQVDHLLRMCSLHGK